MNWWQRLGAYLFGVPVVDVAPSSPVTTDNRERSVEYVERDSPAPDVLGSDAHAVGLQPGTTTAKDYLPVGRSEVGGEQTLFGGEEQTHARQQAEIYERHLWTNTCVSLIARNLRQAEFALFTGTMVEGEEELQRAEGHPMARVFDWWNPYQSASDAWEWITSYLLLTGTAYVYVTTPSDVSPPDVTMELYPLRNQGLRVVRDAEGIVGYIYNLNGVDLRILPEELWLIKGFSTRDRFTGMGRLYAGVQTVRTDLRAREFNENLLKNGVALSGLLKTDEGMSLKQSDEARAAFLSKYQGQSSAGQVAVLHSGMGYESIALDHNDIAWVDQLGMGKQDIADAFGVPLELFGKAANYATLKEKRRLFWEDTVLSWARLIEDSANSTFLPRYDPALVGRWLTDRVDALRPDTQAQVKTARDAVLGGLWTINEARQRIWKMEPVDGGEVLLVPRSTTTLDQTLAEGREAGGVTNNRAAIRLQSPEANKVDKLASTIEDANTIAQTRAADDYNLALRKIYDGQNKELQAAVQEGLSQDELLARGNKVVVVDGGKTNLRAAEEVLAPHQTRYATEYARITGLDAVIQMRNFRAEQVLAKQTNRILGISNRQWKDLRQVILDGFAAGEYEKGLGDRINEFFNGEKRNAATVARTESAAAINGAANEVDLMANAEGVKTLTRWVTSKDDRVRDAHVFVDGTTIDPSEELFVVGASQLQYPGDPGGRAEDVINCRCIAVPVVLNPQGNRIESGR